MVEISNVHVYDLEESLVASGYPMATTLNTEFSLKDIDRGIKLGNTLTGSGHGNFLKGIRVSFDIKYSQYFTKQLQRYTWVDIVSSQSMMHRLTSFNVKGQCNKYVDDRVITILEEYVQQYNDTDPSDKGKKYFLFMRCISNCPMGFQLTMRCSTNYLQLKTIYSQRKSHKLTEDWGSFCRWIERLPYFKELCLK